MGTLNAIYVRATGPAKVAAIHAAYPSAFTEDGTDFFAHELPDEFNECPPELQQLSERLKTDVIWLSFQSVVDAFEYHHWRDGIHIRSLVYGCWEHEREWERVKGSPEEWEAAALFDPTHLRFLLEGLTSEEERRQLHRVFDERLISPGSAEPSLDAREAARGVAEFHRFPGWS